MNAYTATLMLCEESGISELAYRNIQNLLPENVQNMVDATDGKYYIAERYENAAKAEAIRHLATVCGFKISVMPNGDLILSTGVCV